MFDSDRVAGYFVDFSRKTLSHHAVDTRSLLPVDLAQLALGWWERMLRNDTGAEAPFADICSLLERQGERRENDRRWPYFRFIPKYALVPPWYSAMAQAEIASVFVRSYLWTGNEEHARIALEAIAPLTRAGESDLVVTAEEGPILEEAPTNPPSHILNGWIFALWGVWDTTTALADSRAAGLFDASASCLRRMITHYDVGWWSRYSLYPHPLDDLAKPYYHELHSNQLEILYRLTGFPEFRETAARWRSYDRTGRRVLAVTQKASFLAKDYPDRRRRVRDQAKA